MRVEGRDLVDLGLRELHLVGERREMRGGEMPVAVLDEMQMLDQQIAPARPVAEQRAHLVERRRVDLAALRRLRRAALASGPDPPCSVGVTGASIESPWLFFLEKTRTG